MAISEERIEKSLAVRGAKAKRIISSEKRTSQLLRDVERKMNSAGSNRKVQAVIDYVRLMGKMLKCYAKKEYTEVPAGIMIALAACLLYFLSPVDILPDFIPFIGFIDDAAVIAYSAQFAKADLDAFRIWLENEENIVDVEISE